MKLETHLPLKEIVFNQFNWKELNGKYLLVTRDGGSIILEREEFEKTIKKQFGKGDELYNKLQKSRIIVNYNNVNEIQKGYLNRYHFLNYHPSLHIVVISNRCTHKCIYCHAASAGASKSEFDLSLEDAKKVCKTIESTPTNSLVVEFQGGEPLINFEAIKYIIETLEKSQKKIHFALVSNLELMDDEKFDYLVKHKVNICTSLDGDEVVHNTNRKSENKEFNSFKNVEKWIERIKEVQEPGALVTVSKTALPRWKEIIDTYVELGIKSIFLRPLHFLGTAKSTMNTIGYSGEEFMEFYKKALDYIIELNKKGIQIKEMGAIYKLAKMLDKPDPCLSEFMSPSGSCIGQIAYNHDGKVYSCDDGRNEDELFEIGTAGESINEILSRSKVSEIVRSSINDNYDCAQCAYKPFCGFSAPQNYGKLGTTTPINHEDSRCHIALNSFDLLFEKLESQDRAILINWLK